MFQLQSNINVRSAAFRKNQDNYQSLLTEFRERLDKIQRGGSEGAVKKHKARNKLLARERIDLLVDRNTPCVDFHILSVYGVESTQKNLRCLALTAVL